MTAEGSEQIAVDVFRHGARDYLIKPFTEDQVVRAIERALNEQRLEREKLELQQKLKQRVQELNVLVAIGKSVTALLDLEELFERIIEAGIFFTRAEEGRLLLFDSAKQTLLLRAVKGSGADQVRHLEQLIEDQIALQVLTTRQPLRLDADSAQQSILAVPLMLGGNAIGVLEMSNGAVRRRFSDNDQYLLSALADYGAIALENARLFNQVRSSLNALEVAQRQLMHEREKAERLLLNILPVGIAERLKQGQSAIADSFPEVTVLFADIVDFTSFASQVPPAQLVGMLNEIFSTFDSLAEQYGLEKIKTIGDAYMVVAGLPAPRPDHAEASAAMALAMQEAMQRFNKDRGTSFRLRIGINTGPVVAGVIGTKKFIYDLWGDTVNLASRMESQGLPDTIQVTATTYMQLREHYSFEERGIIEIKGKGAMPTFLLRERRKTPNR